MDPHKICIACQECCRWLTFTVVIENRNSDYWENYYKVRGCRIHYMDSVPGSVNMAIMVPSPCPELTEFGCRSYIERPVFCRQYDGRNDVLMRDACQLPKK